MKPYLKDDLISLRSPEPEDIDLLYEWENWEENWTVSNTLVPFSKYMLALYIKNSEKDIYETRQLRLMIETMNAEPVGAIDLFDYDPYHGRVGIGILIHRQEDRSKGFASAALNLMIRYCFDKLNTHQIYANILTDNEVSMKLFSKAGFEVVGTKKEWSREGGMWKDEYMLQLLKKDKGTPYWG